MNFTDNLEQKLGKFAIPHLTEYLIGGQALAFLLIYLHPSYYDVLYLQGDLVLKGQLWRIVTFLFTPLSMSPIFAVLTLYVFYLLGSALERKWGAFRYLLYIVIEYVLIVLFAFIFPTQQLSNGYLYSSIFLAFAYLFPNFTFYILFIIPVKVKWLAMLVWAGIIISLVAGPLSAKILTIIATANFLLFFGNDIRRSGRYKLHGAYRHSSKIVSSRKPYHTCFVCGVNEISDPNMEIRYCKSCVPTTCYCGAHANSHEHMKN